MKNPNTVVGTGRTLLRACAVVGLAAGLSGCGLWSWMTGKSSDSAAAPAAAATAPAAAAPTAPARLGAADASDPVPHNEPLHPTANKWYGANGRLYRPITDDREFKERGKATIIASDQEGQPTASGEPFTTRGFTAAHSRLPIPSYARVTNLRTAKTTVVRVNDRGAYDRDEAIAISAAAAQKIGLAPNDEVEIERITPAEIAAMPANRAAAAPAAAPAPPPPPVAVAAPQAIPAPAETTPLAPQPMAPPAPAPVQAAPSPMPAPAPVASALIAPAAAAVAPAAPGARQANVAPAAAPRAPTRAPAAQSASTGRWSVQIAAFATESMAESTRARVAQTLATNAPNIAESDRTPRVERHGNRLYVLLGDFVDRDAAEALAGRLRAALRQDVVVDRH